MTFKNEANCIVERCLKLYSAYSWASIIYLADYFVGRKVTMPRESSLGLGNETCA